MQITKITNSIVLKSILFVTILLSISCSTDVDNPDLSFTTLPTSNVTTYVGTLLYTNTDGTTVNNPTMGTATISGSSSNYTINFSDAVPSISGVTFIPDNSGSTFAAVKIEGSTVSSIGINDSNLGIELVNNGNTWTFSGTR